MLNIDLAPTLGELAGATVLPPITMDGVSLVPVLNGTVRDWRSDFLGEVWVCCRRKPWATVREERWKYTELTLQPDDPNPPFEFELYDLLNDPYELESLAGDPAQADRVAAMSRRLRELRPTWPLDTAGVVK